MNLGSLLRHYRKDKKLTLKTVAEQAGVSEGFLSQVENDVKSPSVDTLMGICRALGVNAGELMDRAQNRERLVIIRKSDWDDVDFSHTGFATRRFFAPEDRQVIDSAVLFLEPGKSIPVRPNVKNGQEILCILKGCLDLVHGERTTSLIQGDAVHFWTETNHQEIINRSRDLAIALWVGTL
jgi:transcriptional regulator with XRE-family HTH domain